MSDTLRVTLSPQDLVQAVIELKELATVQNIIPLTLGQVLHDTPNSCCSSCHREWQHLYKFPPTKHYMGKLCIQY